jgi:FtsP/CotA-like multicopper oxidase with cupredoxin domain
MSSNRRDFLRGAALGALGLLSAKKAVAQSQPAPAPAPLSRTVPVETPDGGKLPWRRGNGFKEFHLVAEPVTTEFLPGKTVQAWGYNGSVPGPMIEVNEGDRVRIVVDNHLPEATSMHWHGLEVPLKMDGVPGISQPPIQPGERYVYEFTVHQHGTFFYHSHMPMQEMMGMIGLFVIYPRIAYEPAVDKDFGIILQEWAILPNNPVPNTLSMEFNWLTLNGKSGPASTPLIVKQGERVRIRFVNLGMDHHPMHLHGNTFYVTATEAGRIPQQLWIPENTVLVGVAQARVIEFDAKYAGEWMLHCHLPHHMMNQMASMVGPKRMGGGMPSGMSMEQGMGMIKRGPATSDENGPSMGRSMGVGSTNEQSMTHIVGHDMSSMQDQKPVPGFPQDMWMTMDEMVVKPETYGLPAGWTGGMMGMMTLVRVLPPELYNKVKQLQSKAGSQSMEMHK